MFHPEKPETIARHARERAIQQRKDEIFRYHRCLYWRDRFLAENTPASIASAESEQDTADRIAARSPYVLTEEL